MTTLSLGLRPVCPEDEPFLFAVYASTRAEELSQVPWDEVQKRAFLQMQFNAQRHHYERAYPHALHQVILQGELPVGRLWSDRTAERIHLLDLTILPAHRGSGLGSTLLRELQGEAAGSDQAITIYVESFNPSLRLFERLGFQRVAEEGAHLLLRWQVQD